MIVIQHYEKCLSQFSYYLEYEGIAAVIDPLRDIAKYEILAKERNAQIKYIFETHFHADFVSGHLELAQKTGARIIFGPGAMTGFDAHHAFDGELFTMGGYSIKVLHTPGHTIESSCYLLLNKKGIEEAIFTGDTLFLGDVGRPDLAQGSNFVISKEHLAGMLYDSLEEKISPLRDEVIVYPGHGAGSACGKNMSNELSTTLGEQKVTNYAMNADYDRQRFVMELCQDLPTPPPYFAMNAQLNKAGYKLMESAKSAKDVKEFFNLMQNKDVIVLDTRPADSYAFAHISGSINIGLDGSFAPWVGAVIPESKRILLVCDSQREDEAITRLARIGFENISGYLAVPIEEWKVLGYPTDMVPNLEASEYLKLIPGVNSGLIDVRTISEYAKGAIAGAINIPLSNDMDLLQITREGGKYSVYCAGGYRSMIFISLLKAKGIANLTNIKGGYSAIEIAKAVKVSN